MSLNTKLRALGPVALANLLDANTFLGIEAQTHLHFTEGWTDDEIHALEERIRVVVIRELV